MRSKIKKIIIFGGGGFIGSHVVDELISRGFSVTVFDLKKSLYVNPKARFIKGDILDKDQVKTAIKGIDIVYNFAGIMDIKYCHDHPDEALNVNIIGNSNILDASVKEKITLYVYASSLYVNTDRGSFYRITKYASELVIQEFHRLFGINYVILRYGSLYGPRADERNGIYKFINSAIEKGEIVHRGTHKDKREFIHIQDAAKMSSDIINKKHWNKIYRIIGPENLKVIDVAKEIFNKLGKKPLVKIEPSHRLNYEHTAYNYKFKKGEPFYLKTLMTINKSIENLIQDAKREKK